MKPFHNSRFSFKTQSHPFSVSFFFFHLVFFIYSLFSFSLYFRLTFISLVSHTSSFLYITSSRSSSCSFKKILIALVLSDDCRVISNCFFETIPHLFFFLFRKLDVSSHSPSPLPLLAPLTPNPLHLLSSSICIIPSLSPPPTTP